MLCHGRSSPPSRSPRPIRPTQRVRHIEYVPVPVLECCLSSDADEVEWKRRRGSITNIPPTTRRPPSPPPSYYIQRPVRYGGQPARATTMMRPRLYADDDNNFKNYDGFRQRRHICQQPDSRYVNRPFDDDDDDERHFCGDNRHSKRQYQDRHGERALYRGDSYYSSSDSRHCCHGSNIAYDDDGYDNCRYSGVLYDNNNGYGPGNRHGYVIKFFC